MNYSFLEFFLVVFSDLHWPWAADTVKNKIIATVKLWMRNNPCSLSHVNTCSSVDGTVWEFEEAWSCCMKYLTEGRLGESKVACNPLFVLCIVDSSSYETPGPCSDHTNFPSPALILTCGTVSPIKNFLLQVSLVILFYHSNRKVTKILSFRGLVFIK